MIWSLAKLFIGYVMTLSSLGILRKRNKLIKIVILLWNKKRIIFYELESTSLNVKM